MTIRNRGNWFVRITNNLYNIRYAILFVALGAFLIACTKDEKPPVSPPDNPTTTFKGIESPYLVCANRNPGGVGFDFEYKGQKGGANNMDNLTVSDFDADLIIRVITAQKPNSTSFGGAPFIKLASGVTAVNYSELDTQCVGKDRFTALTKAEADAKNYTLKADDATFDLNNVEKGSTGKADMQALKKEYTKLVIGDKWQATANDITAQNEIVWIIKTKEDKFVKFIVTEFPAKNAPTATGYTVIEWDFLK